MKIKNNTYLIIDPCYIKAVRYGTEMRFDALKQVATFNCDDGSYSVSAVIDGSREELGSIGVDSGRIWVLKAEFDCDVIEDSGFSGYILVNQKASDFEIECEVEDYDEDE